MTKVVGQYIRGDKQYEDLIRDDKGYYVINYETGKQDRISRDELANGLRNFCDCLRINFKKDRVELTSITYDGIKLTLYGRENNVDFDLDENDEGFKECIRNEMVTDLMLTIMDICCNISNSELEDIHLDF